MILMAFSMFGAMFFLTFFFQGVHGLSPLESGLRMLPMSAGMIVASPLAGMAIGKLGPRITIAEGMLITAVSMFLHVPPGAGSRVHRTARSRSHCSPSACPR